MKRSRSYTYELMDPRELLSRVKQVLKEGREAWAPIAEVTGAGKARYLALRWGSWRYRFMRLAEGDGSTYTSVKEGGGQIEYEDEDPDIHREFESALDKVGATCGMGSVHPSCSQRRG